MNGRQQSPIDKVRVIGIFAHVDAGKTTTSEGILYHTGRIHRAGSVDEGSTQLDWMEQERQRGITVTSAATTCDWRGHQFNLIDTPGHIDFSAEVLRSIHVIDSAVMVLCGVGGVEPQTETVWMHAERENLPRLIFVNKLDRQGADFSRVVEEARKLLTPNVVPLQMPIGREKEFAGVVDLIGEQALVWNDGSEEPTLGTVPPSMKAEAASARASLLDTICETDERLLEQRLAGHEPSRESLQNALRRATITGELVPVICGSALSRVGIQPLLDAAASYLPSPLDVPDADPDAPFCAVAFKIVVDSYVGHLTWVRVFSGTLKAGGEVYNPRNDVRERVSRIYRMHANKREQVAEMSASDVVALAGVRSAGTGDTLCDPKSPVEPGSLRFPDPVIMTALKAESDDGLKKLHEAVARLCREDPTLVSGFDPETSEGTLAGMGELHLEIAVDRLRTEFGLTCQVGPPQIAYRETVRRRGQGTGAYKKQTGGHGHFAEVSLCIEPGEPGSGVVFKSEAATPDGPTGATRGLHSYLPAEHLRFVERGIREALGKGIIAGYSMSDVRVTLSGGRVHEVDSSGMDFLIAGSMAVREAARSARPTLVEPIMRLDVNVVEEHLGAITTDLGRRRGHIKSIETRGNVRNVTGEVPLAEARGYATAIRGLTQGRATFMLELLRYDVVPDEIAKEVVDKRRSEGKVSER